MVEKYKGSDWKWRRGEERIKEMKVGMRERENKRREKESKLVRNYKVRGIIGEVLKEGLRNMLDLMTMCLSVINKKYESTLVPEL